VQGQGAELAEKRGPRGDHEPPFDPTLKTLAELSPADWCPWPSAGAAG